MAFERKSWYQFYARGSSSMKDTSDYLRGLFHKALEGCNPEMKAKFLLELDKYLFKHHDQFDTKTLVSFVARLRDLQSQPRAVEEPYAWPDADVKTLRNQGEAEPWKDPKGNLFTGKVVSKGKLGESESERFTASRCPLPIPASLFQISRSCPEEGI